MFGNRAWPKRIWVVRHGQSVGNLAWDQAEADGKLASGINGRNADAPLSDLGRRQAAAVGFWFKEMPRKKRPTVVVSSPYTRATGTAEGIVDTAGLRNKLQVFTIDERLRQKEFGILAGLPTARIRQKYPEETARIDHL